MLFELVESKGLAHYSYLVGDGNEAVVVDPRRDCGTCVERATQAGLRIAHVLETHRNEDYVVGSVELAARTGARSGTPTRSWTTNTASRSKMARRGRSTICPLEL